MKTQSLYTLRNHNGVIIYQGFSAADCAKEKRMYEIQTGNPCMVEIEIQKVKKMKFSLIAKHKELRELSWDMPEFKRLVLSGDIRNPSVYMPRIKCRIFGFTFDLPVFGIVYFVEVKL